MGKKFQTVFVTGGAGYIGSHCVLDLLEAGYDVVAVDNFSNCRRQGEHSPALQRVEKITKKKVSFYCCDLLDEEKLNKIFSQHSIDCVIHFAALKAVGESMEMPLPYYLNNISGTINLCKVMKQHKVYQFVFSSSCTVYGNPDHLPITEDHPTGNVTNVYGRTKFFLEEMLKDLSRADKEWNIISLRYFNPVGAHPSGLIGEDPTKEYTNLMPYIGQVALGYKPHLTVFGNDYNTPDGTGVRDYIHVMDLASGHVAALKKLEKDQCHWKFYNLGIGKGFSVLQLAKEFERVSGRKVPCKIGPRRPFNVDVDELVSGCSLALKELDWAPYRGVTEMCEDFWRWLQMNPNGYLDGPKESEKKEAMNVTNGTNGQSENNGC